MGISAHESNVLSARAIPCPFLNVGQNSKHKHVYALYCTSQSHIYTYTTSMAVYSVIVNLFKTF